MPGHETTQLGELDDARLVELFLERRDDACFVALHERYVGRVYRRALSFCRDRVEAEDLTQEIFVKVFLSLHRFRGDSSFSTWLYRVATNHCLNFLRARREFLSLDEDPDRGVPGRRVDPGRARTAGASLRDTLEELPRGAQALLLLKFRDGYTYEEIAERTGLSESAVKMRISRARIQIREARA